MSDEGKRIALAAIPRGGYTKGGERVTFSLQALDGRMFDFSCPHEAVSEIIEALLHWTTLAKKERGGTDIDKQLGPNTRAMTQLTASRVGCSLDGKLVILELQYGPVFQHKLSMPPEAAKILSTSLAGAQLKCLEIVAPQKGRAN